MTPEEHNERMNKLMREAFKKFLLFHVCKWGAFFVVTHILRKWARSLPDA